MKKSVSTKNQTLLKRNIQEKAKLKKTKAKTDTKENKKKSLCLLQSTQTKITLKKSVSTENKTSKSVTDSNDLIFQSKSSRSRAIRGVRKLTI